MKIRVKKKKKSFAVVHRNLLFCENISLQAKGLCAVLEIYSDDFEVSFETLKLRTKLSDKTLRKYVKELEQNSFIYRIQIKCSCQIVWFIDSETLDYHYVKSEITNYGKPHHIRHITAYPFLVGENLTGEEITTYNNTNTDQSKFTDKDALNIMFQVQKENQKSKKQRSYIQNPRRRNKLTVHDTVRPVLESQSNTSTHSTHNFVPKFVQNIKEIEF